MEGKVLHPELVDFPCGGEVYQSGVGITVSLYPPLFSVDYTPSTKYHMEWKDIDV